MTNQFVWVDIPVRELDRAIAFYTVVLGAQVKKDSFEGSSFGIFPHADYSYLRTSEASSGVGIPFRCGCLYEPKPGDNQASQTSPQVSRI